VSADIEPVSLRFLLKKTNRPSLGSLFDLAQTISQSLLNFHKADWLKRDISSHNVIFFDRRLSNLRGRSRHRSKVEEPILLDDLPSPYLVGFNHSRPNDPGTFTSGGSDLLKMYQHPEYANNVKQRFHLSYDYYSVGLLLEIGLWELLADHHCWVTGGLRNGNLGIYRSYGWKKQYLYWDQLWVPSTEMRSASAWVMN
jgi:hypothetical protein